jgi:hypothetical protein
VGCDSLNCKKIAEEECALASHGTRNIVCCAKHHLEVPCSSCLEAVKQSKEASEKKEEEPAEEENS